MNINWYPGHMAKTKKQIIEDLKLIDVVIEILDARIPISSRNPDIEALTKDKKKILILNKADLADSKENEKWKEYFKNNKTIAILADSNSGTGINEVQKQIEKLMQEELEKQAAKGRIGKNIRVMILGIPNVGKSSFINRMAKKTSAIEGNKPGVTRQKQWIRIGNNIELLDTPGVLWPKFENEKVALNLAFTGTIKQDVIDEVEVAYYLLKYLMEYEKEKLYTRYNIDEDDDILNIMHQIGRKRGAIVSGGKVDEIKTAKIILDDFQSGKLGKITLERVK